VDARPRWTDDRLDDQAEELRGFRSEVREDFRSVREEIRELRRETHEDIRDLGRELRESHRWLIGLQLTTLLGLVAVAVQVAIH